VVNHQRRHRDQHRIATKHVNVAGSHPHRPANRSQSEKSNWPSSPGAVSIGTDTVAAGENRGPRWSRT
jgi:hypothetical protein